MRLMAVLLAALAALLVGCGGPSPAPSPTGARPVVAPERVPAVTEVLRANLTPVRIEVPAIGVSSSLIALGLDADGGWAVPPVEAPEQASWFSGGPRPGEIGPAVVLGHVDGGGKPGVFARLDELDAGDVVVVRAASGTVTRFAVTRVDREPKRSFPTEEVLGYTPLREIRLITCGGDFDERAKSYQDSVIAYGVATGSA